MARCSENSHSRLVKVVADDIAVSKLYVLVYSSRTRMNDHYHPRNHTHGSPVLLHNLIRENRLESLISLHPSPFGSREPPVPIARSVTIARVASPISINKIHQKSFLEALKAYFSHRRHLVKQGDLVAVGIDTDTVMRQEDDSASTQYVLFYTIDNNLSFLQQVPCNSH